jgi:polyhydroxybutyrate depolymerase
MSARAFWLFPCVAIACVACGGDDEDEGGGAGGSGGSAGAGQGGSSGSSGGSSGAAGAPSGCGSSTLQAGNQTRTLTIGGIERQYLLHVPPSYDPTTPTPLVLNFHGYTSNMSQQMAFSLMNAKSDSAGFLLAYPDGLKNPNGFQSWNAGYCCAFDDLERDDLGFVNAVLDDIQAAGCVDDKRVYSTGMSNGGYLSHLLGCKLADRIAAIAPVAGVLGIPAAECQPTRPLSVIHFHGTADGLVPYDGVGGFISVPQTFQDWAARNGCSGDPVQSFTNGAAHCDTYEDCEGGVKVTLCTIDGEGHCWPGQTVLCPFGATTADISANDAMWELFQSSSLP